MSSSGGGTAESIKLQRESLEESKRTNAAQLTFMERQMQALRKTQVAPFLAQAPAPTMGTSGADFASAQEKINASRRFGYNKTVRAGARFGGAAVA